MKAIVTADLNFAVSNKNSSLASIPAEKKLMLKEVMGHTVIYDAHFIKELPGQQPVKGCRNLIFTDGMKVSYKGAECFETIEALKDFLCEEGLMNEQEVYIIHGAALYNAFFDDIDTFHVTKIEYEYSADAYIPNLDKTQDFAITAESDELFCFDIIYYFLKYERTRK